MRLALGCVAAALLWAGSAERAAAILVMHVNPTAETFYFSGTAIGNPVNDMGTKSVVWSLDGDTGASSTFVGTDVGIDVLSNSFASVATPTLTFFSGAPAGVNLTVILQDNSETEFYGITGMPQSTTSYAGMAAAEKSYLASLIGSSIPLTVGTGFGPISVVGVPEPGACLVMGLVGCGLWTKRTRGRGGI